MNKELFQKDISEKDITRWQCPNCQKGRLSFDKKISYDLTNLIPEEEINRFDFIKYHNIAGFLKCDYCNKKVMFLASALYSHSSQRNPINNKIVFEEDERIFYPYIFIPPLNIIELNELIPDEIKKELIKSFSLYWIDFSACANKNRTIVELILNQQKIRKTFTDVNGKRRKSTLHKRIQQFSKKNQKAADYLMAIKWVGNTGSHSNKLTREGLLEVYEILEYVLNILYDSTYERLMKNMLKINKKRGPIY